MIFSVAPGVSLAVSLPPSTGTSGSSPAMQHKGRRADRLQEIDPAPARQDREHLPADAGRIIGTVEGAFDLLAQLRLRRGIAGTADGAIDVHAELD